MREPGRLGGVFHDFDRRRNRVGDAVEAEWLVEEGGIRGCRQLESWYQPRINE